MYLHASAGLPLSASCVRLCQIGLPRPLPHTHAPQATLSPTFTHTKINPPQAGLYSIDVMRDSLPAVAHSAYQTCIFNDLILVPLSPANPRPHRLASTRSR